VTRYSWRAWLVTAGCLLWSLGCAERGERAAPVATAPASTAEHPAAEAAAARDPSAAMNPSTRAAEVKLCEHRVPADLCTKCNPEFVDVFKEKGDWCNEHGVPESHCYECNPKLSFSARAAPPAEPWCNEHGVPEAKCTKCKPQLIAKFIDAGDYCREHGLPESVCPYCHPDLVKAAGHEPPIFPAPGTTVKLASPETEREAGIETMTVTNRQFARTIDVIGQLQFNQNRLARLSARGGEALVGQVNVDVGDEVKRGQPLVMLTSGAIGAEQSRQGAAKARLDAARATLAREQVLLESGISSNRSVEQAQTEVAAALGEYNAARAALHAAGAGEGSSGGQYVLSAPFDGTVVAREAVAGKSVSAETTLVEVADLGSMWALLEIPEDAAAAVKPGQKVTLVFEGLGGQIREGVVSRMGASVDPHTRTVRARVDLPNADRTLRAGLFVRAKIAVAAEHEGMLVPRGAIQRAEGQALVFVRTAPGQYVPAHVELGTAMERDIEVLGGLESGAEVVTTGAFMLKTEILKDSIGAGCADD